jgi:hypothetical protein
MHPPGTAGRGQNRLAAVRGAHERRPPGVPLSFKLPTIRSSRDVERAAEKVTEALHRGQCTTAEATEVMRFLQAHTQLQGLQMESRLDELEERIEGREGGAEHRS